MNRDNLLSDQPIARDTDAFTSHRAARQITEDGTRGHQQQQVLKLVQTYPDHTTGELGTVRDDVDRYVVARRMSELEDGGYVKRCVARECRVSGRACLTWRPLV